MSNPFNNYPIYVIPEHSGHGEVSPNPVPISEVPDTEFVVLLAKKPTEKARQKMIQILSAVKFSETDYTVLDVADRPSIIDNVLSNKKITGILIFGDANKHFPSQPMNEAHTAGHQEVFLSYGLDELVEEEREGRTDKRMALWTGLKRWLLSE